MRWNDRIGRRLKLNDLHILLAVAQSGSMTKAARQLAVSHPVVSRSINHLEHALGVRLLERNPHGVALTESGRAMLARSHAAFDELRQGVRDIEFLADPTAGEMRIASTAPLAASFISAVITRLTLRHPRLTFRVETGTHEALLSLLHERQVDLLVSREFNSIADKRLTFETLYHSPYVVAAGLESPWLRRRKIDLADLLQERWALPPRDGAFGAFVADVFRAKQLDYPQATVTAFDHDLRINLVKTGQYVTILAEFLLQFPTKHPSIRRLPIKLPINSGAIVIGTLTGRPLSPIAGRFLACARELAKPLAKPHHRS